MSQTISIIIPVFNEEKGIAHVIEKILDLNLKNSELIVVDDGSIDGTLDQVNKFDVKCVSHKSNKGKAEAFRTGLENASGEIIIMIDGDDTYPVSQIPEIVNLITQGYDSVVGSRFKGSISGMTALNKFGNNIITFALRTLYGSKTTDPLSGLRGFRRSVFEKVTIHSDRFELETEISIKVACLGLNETDIPIDYNERLGDTKLNPLNDGFKIFRHMFFLLQYYNPFLLFMSIGALLLFGGFSLAVTLVYGYIENNYYFVQPHSAVLSSFLIIAGVNIIFFGIILEIYLFGEGIRKRLKGLDFLFQKDFRMMSQLGGILFCGIGLILGVDILIDWMDGLLTTEYPRVGIAVLSMLFGILGFQILFFSIVVDVLTKTMLGKNQ